VGHQADEPDIDSTGATLGGYERERIDAIHFEVLLPCFARAIMSESENRFSLT
jgi:hypothetical protein